MIFYGGKAKLIDKVYFSGHLQVGDAFFFNIIRDRGNIGNHGVHHSKRDFSQSRVNIRYQVQVQVGVITGNILMGGILPDHGNFHAFEFGCCQFLIDLLPGNDDPGNFNKGF